MRQRIFDKQDGFAGGVNTTADDLALQPNELRRAENARLTIFGAVRKREGTRRLHAPALSSGAVVRGGFCWQQPSNVTHLVVVGNRFYTGVWSGDVIAWTERSTAFTGSGRVRFAAFRGGGADCVYIADGTILRKWDGTTLVDLGSLPAVRSLRVYNQRLHGWTGDNETHYWSGINNGDTLGDPSAPGPDKGGSAIVRTYGDRAITTGGVVGSSLLLLHNSGISRFTGLTSDDISIASGTMGLTPDVGTIAPDSVVELENGLAFLSDRGVYIATEGQVSPVDGPVDDLMPGLSESQAASVLAVHNRVQREVWYLIPDSGVWVLNYRLGKWSGPWTGGYVDPDLTAMWEAVDENGRPIVLLGDVDGWVRQADVSNTALDNVASDGTGGMTYQMLVRTRRMFAVGPALEKSLRWLYLVGNLRRSSSVVITAGTRTGRSSYGIPNTSFSKWGETGATWGASGARWGFGEGALLRYRVPIAGRGEYFDVDVVDDSDTANVIVSRIEVEAFALGRRE